MQQPSRSRQSNGSKAIAIAIDQRIMLARYRFFLLLSVILSVAFSLSLHLIFAR